MSVPWYLMAKGKGGGGYKTASGPIVSVSDALAAPLRSLLVNIEPVQDLHGYDNPWPAGGGKNLAPFEDVLPDGFTKTERGVTVTVSNGVVHLRGVSESTTTWNILDYRDVWRYDSYYIPAGTYSVASRLIMRIGSVNHGGTFTIDEERQVSGFYIFVSADSYGQEVSYDIPLAFVSGSTIPTAWTPYSNICPISGWSEVNVWVKPTYDPTANPTATIQLGDTFYGGTLDVINGVLTVEYAILSKKWSEGTNSGTATDIQRKAFFPPVNADISIRNKFKCNCAKVVGSYGVIGLLIVADNQFYLTLPTDTDGDTNIQILYPLATPITIPLTPTEISTLQGQNNLWADSGDATIEYLSSGGANSDLMKLAVAFMGRD